MPAHWVFAVQFLPQPFAKARSRHQKALAPHMRLPLHPFHRSALLFLNVYALPPGDFHDVAVVQLLQLEEQLMLDIVKALVHDRAIAVESLHAVHNDGVFLHTRRDRRKLRLLNILTDQHFTRVKEQDARRSVTLVQWQVNDLQPQAPASTAGRSCSGLCSPSGAT